MLMKRLFSTLLGMFVVMMAMAQDVTLVKDISTYDGNAPYVYSQSNSQFYVLNALGYYERYGIYETATAAPTPRTSTTTKEIEFIKTDEGSKAYIDLGYKPKYNTKIETVYKAVEGPDWKALYGTRFEANTQNGVEFPGTVNYSAGNGWKQGFAFFPTNGAVNLGGETVEKDKMIFGEKVRIVQDGATGTLEIYKGETLSELANTIQDSPLEGDCETSLYVFAINKHLPVIEGYNDNPETFGSNSDPCYNPYVTLYSMKVYEGTTLVLDLVPAVYNGKGALKDKLTDTYYSSATNDEFVTSSDAGVTAYQNKMVIFDGNVYKYNGTEFVNIGAATKTLGGEIADEVYKDLNNWETNNDHKGIYAGNWQQTDNGWKIDPYVGTGGWEPLMVKVNTVAGSEYNLSFTYSGCEYTSWNADNPPMAAFVSNNWDLGTQAHGTEDFVLGSEILPFAAQTNMPVSIDFTAKQDWQALVLQFGLVNDGESYWFQFDNMSVKQYYYGEAYPILNQYKPMLKELIEEATTLTTYTEAQRTALDAVLAESQAVASGEDMPSQREAIDNLQKIIDTIKGVNANNVDALNRTVELAATEGFNTDAATEFFANGMSNGDLDNTLRQLRNARKNKLAERQPNVFKGNDVKAGQFYLYNVGQQRFFTGGSDWGTHAALGMPGTLITLEEMTDEEIENARQEAEPNKATDFHINTGLRNGGEDDNPSQYLSYRGYCDQYRKGAWRFVKLENGNYNILQADYPDVFVKYSPTAGVDGGNGDFTTVGTEERNVTEEDLDAQWILVTKADRDALLDAATADAPADASYYIVNPGFCQRAEVEPAWTIFNGSVWGRGDNHSDFALESFDTSDCSFSTSVQGLKPGFYLVSCQGFYRNGDQNAWPELERSQNAYLFNGMNDVLLPSIDSEDVIGKAPGEGRMYEGLGEFPDGIDQACRFFQNGLYKVSLLVEVYADGILDIGVGKDEKGAGGDWVVVDNFRLTYFGTTEPTEEQIEKATPVETVKAEATTVAGKTYTLQGVEVKTLSKGGIYVCDGRKIVVK